MFGFYLVLRYLVSFLAFNNLEEVHYFNCLPGPEAIKLFPCSTQLSMEFQMLIKYEVRKNKDYCLCCLIVFCHFPTWYPGSDQILDCFDS